MGPNLLTRPLTPVSERASAMPVEAEGDCRASTAAAVTHISLAAQREVECVEYLTLSLIIIPKRSALRVYSFKRD